MQAGAVRRPSFDRYDSDAVQFSMYFRPLMIHPLSLFIIVMTILQLYAPLISCFPHRGAHSCKQRGSFVSYG